MAVITTCLFFEGIRLIQGICLFLLVLIYQNRVALANPMSCDSVRHELQAKNLRVYTSERPVLGPICGAESCCGKETEDTIKNFNRIHIDLYLKDSINKISSLIENRARRFDDFFREMMNNSKKEFHEMFEKTYGKIYLQNSDVFSTFFSELETYYKKGTLRLSETLDNFFGILYQRMFTVINGQYDFDEKYLLCVSEHMTEMMPFGDVPHKLGIQLRRSFVATRTFYKSLFQGALVANKMNAIKVDEDCAKEITKMQQCGICTRQPSAGACADYCTSILENCLQYHVSFSQDWDKYIDRLDKVADRLLGSFNIENVVEPLNIKISDAVMNFQERGSEVSKKIYGVCGQPTLNRRKRKAYYDGPIEANSDFEIKYDHIKLGGRKKNKKAEKVDNIPALQRLILEIKTKIRETKQFWIHLPYQYCNNESIAAPPSANGQCWNGTAVGSYKKPPIKILKMQSPIVNEQNFTLQVYIDKLRKAHEGEEVELVDDSEETLTGSGSGSGDGDDLRNEDEEDMATKVHNKDESVTSKPVSPPVTVSTIKPKIILNESSSSAEVHTVSLTKALLQYVIPIVLVWFGGSLTELL